MCDAYYSCLLLKGINNLFLALTKGKRQMLGMIIYIYIYIYIYSYIYSFIPVFCMLVILFDFHPSSTSISHKYDMIYANLIKHRNILICKKAFTYLWTDGHERFCTTQEKKAALDVEK